MIEDFYNGISFPPSTIPQQGAKIPKLFKLWDFLLPNGGVGGEGNTLFSGKIIREYARKASFAFRELYTLIGNPFTSPLKNL